MKCVMCQGIYLQASGRLPCYCGAGAVVTLGNVPLANGEIDFVKNFYRGKTFNFIRESMMAGKVPFPGICDQCTYLDLDEELEPAALERTIEWFQWEPASTCNLDCEWCEIEPGEFTYRDNRLFPLARFKEIVDNLADHGYRLWKGTAAGAGEPTLNKNAWKMIRWVKEKLGGNILMSTNGNTRYTPDIITCGLDTIKIAIDGIDQETYSRYRKHGKLEKILDLTRNIAREKEKLGSKTPKIMWQYILFNYNDSDRHLVKFQEMAKDYGVNALRLVYTRCAHYSQRHPEDFPTIFPDIVVLPIKEYSLADLGYIKEKWESLQGSMENGDPVPAILETLRFVKQLYYRFTLGVKNYAELYKFTEKIIRIKREDYFVLEEEQYLTYVDYLDKGFKMLARQYDTLGEKEQAQKYRDYRARLKIEGVEE